MPTREARSTQSHDASNGSTTGRGAISKTIRQDLLNRIGERKFDKWFSQTDFAVRGKTLHVSARSGFIATWIDRNFGDELRTSVRAHLGGSAAVNIAVFEDDAATDEESKSHTPPPEKHASARKRKRSEAGILLKRFDDFVVGPSNQLAMATSQQLASDPDASLISPLFVHGECGVGKTHLLQSICARFVEITKRPDRVRYMTGEQFTNEFITAIKGSGLDAFRRKTRKLELLVVDDVHFLGGKMRTQSEFLHTLDAIDLAGAKVVLASDSHPRHVGSFRQALISRFLSGMVVQIDRPQREMRKQLIDVFSKRRGIKVNEAAAELIAGHCVGSVRELEGTVIKLSALQNLTSAGAESSEVGVVIARQLFEDHGWHPSSPVRMSTITEVICERLAVDRGDLLGSRRHRRVVLARALVAHLGRELTTHSYPEIAQSLGRTYHSTVHTAAQRLRRQLDADESIDLANGERTIRLRELVDQLRHEIIKASAGR